MSDARPPPPPRSRKSSRTRRTRRTTRPRAAADRRERASASRGCPYLDTVNRSATQSAVDFEKCCSGTLSPHNVYACLVCGKYFQGRGPNTQAYTHSLEASHHVAS